MRKHKGLGRGLDSFFSAVPADPYRESDEAEKIISCPVDALVAGRYQPRTFIDSEILEELAASIRAHGLMQPIIVRPIAGEQYEIIAGERRWRACQLAGLNTISAIVRDIPDEVALPLSIIENIQRESLSVIDEARAIKRLSDEFNLTHQQIADTIGRSRTSVTNLMRLLTLPETVLHLLNDGCLEMGHARALLTLNHEDRVTLAHQVVDQSLSVRQTEDLVRHWGAEPTKRCSPKPDATLQRLQEKLSDILCAAVTMSQGSRGNFRLTIAYDHLDQVNDFLERLGVCDDS